MILTNTSQVRKDMNMTSFKTSTQSVTLDWRPSDLFGQEECYLRVEENKEIVLTDGPYPNIDAAMRAYKIWVKLIERRQ